MLSDMAESLLSTRGSEFQPRHCKREGEIGGKTGRRPTELAQPLLLILDRPLLVSKTRSEKSL